MKNTKNMKNITLLTFSAIAAATVSASAATVTLLETTTNGVFDIFEDVGGTNIGTVTMSGPGFNTNAAFTVSTTDSGSMGSDSITFAALTGTGGQDTTFTFAFLAGYALDVAEFGTEDGVGAFGEIQGGQRPVGYAANFSGTVVDYFTPDAASDIALTLNSTVSNTGGTLIGSTPIAYTAGEFIVNPGLINDGTSIEQYLILSNTLNSTAPIVFTAHNGGSGGDADPARFSFTVVPEPSSTALLGLGGLMLVTRRKRA